MCVCDAWMMCVRVAARDGKRVGGGVAGMWRRVL